MGRPLISSLSWLMRVRKQLYSWRVGEGTKGEPGRLLEDDGDDLGDGLGRGVAPRCTRDEVDKDGEQRDGAGVVQQGLPFQQDTQVLRRTACSPPPVTAPAKKRRGASAIPPLHFAMLPTFCAERKQIGPWNEVRIH